MSYKIDRKTYAQTYGPTTGDRVRLADTELFIEVEKDLTSSPYVVKSFSTSIKSSVSASLTLSPVVGP